jgi:hypothetical protein
MMKSITELSAAYVALEGAMKENQIVIRDDGKTIDRYTAYRLHTPKAERNGLFIPMIGFSAEPFHPQGVGSHEEGLPGRHLGKRIHLSDLPPNARAFVVQEFGIEAY